MPSEPRPTSRPLALPLHGLCTTAPLGQHGNQTPCATTTASTTDAVTTNTLRLGPATSRSLRAACVLAA
eukprot:2710771-Heterocapsa_arctica.AAC.1